MSTARVTVDRRTKWGGEDQAVRYADVRIGYVHKTDTGWTAKADDVDLGGFRTQADAVAAVVKAADLNEWVARVRNAR